MIVDLNKLDYRHAKQLILWCVANNIDKERADKLHFAWYTAPNPLAKGTLYGEEVVWELDIPEEHLTYFMLKWR
jgi:hypothetical protein